MKCCPSPRLVILDAGSRCQSCGLFIPRSAKTDAIVLLAETAAAALTAAGFTVSQFMEGDRA